METAITGRPGSLQPGPTVTAPAGSSRSAFAALFAQTAAFVGKQPAAENGEKQAEASAEKIIETLEAHPEKVNELMAMHPDLEEVVMFIAELVLSEQDGEPVPQAVQQESMPAEQNNIFTKLAVLLHAPDAKRPVKAPLDTETVPKETGSKPLGSGTEDTGVEAELPVLEQLATRFNDLTPGDRQLIHQAAEKLQQAVVPLLTEKLSPSEQTEAEEVFTNRLNELTVLLSKVMPEQAGSTRPEASFIAAAVASSTQVSGTVEQEKPVEKNQKQSAPPKGMAPQLEMSQVEQLNILFPEKTPAVRQLISYLEQQPATGENAKPPPRAAAEAVAQNMKHDLTQVPAGWMSQAAGQETAAETVEQTVKRGLQQWQKHISEQEQAHVWVPKALQKTLGEQSERQVTAFITSLSALAKQQPPASGRGESEKHEAITAQLERILRSIRSEAVPPPSLPASMTESKTFQSSAPLVIQLPPASEGTQRQAEFLKQFHQTLGSMNTIHLKNGASYTIRLHPEHLGRLDVKLTKIEGQWTAQLITTSKAGQELVESSIHQLRQSFLQQNLQVERIEVAAQPDLFEEEEQKEEDEKQQAGNVQEETVEEEDQSFEDMLQQLAVDEWI